MISTLNAIINWIFPQQCFVCFTSYTQEDGFCGKCTVDFIQDPWCDKCGFPMPFSIDVCHGCTTAPYSKGRSAVIYNDLSKKMIMHYKHFGKTYLGKTFAEWMVRVDETIFLDVDYLVAVPLHWTRRFIRRYNQSTLLAKYIQKHTNIPIAYHALIRKKRTKTQTGNAKERFDNIKGAFQTNKDFKGKVLLLIDDVWTTGATIHHGVETLLRDAHAKEVRVLTLARVIN